MRMIDIILKKKNKIELSKEEINWFVDGFTKGDIPDYQVSSFLMAVVLNNMTKSERLFLTQAMVNSGQVVDLSKISGVKVDKHSTGGVGDKTTFVLAPLVAACGVPVAKMSGRGLGHTGGTIDKLEAIPNIKIDIPQDEFLKQVATCGISVVGQTGELAPADKKLYALRDVTGTVESIPLIASSIMSKKIAAGSDAIVLDVKLGTGAFMKTLDEARELATTMVEIGNGAGRSTVACITSMVEPLGLAVGNNLEVIEAIDVLKGEGPKDVLDLVLELGSHMVVLGKKADTFEEAKAMLLENIKNGKGFSKLKEFLSAQGGDTSLIDDTNLFEKAKHIIPVIAKEDGYIESIDALAIGVAAMKLGAGRSKKDDVIDMAVGIVLNKKQSEKVSKGDCLAYLHSNSEETTEVYNETFDAFKISKSEVEKVPLIYEVIK